MQLYDRLKGKQKNVRFSLVTILPPLNATTHG